MLAVDVIARETRILWSKTGLPHNSCRLISVSEPLQHNMYMRDVSKLSSPNDHAAAGEVADELLAEYSTSAMAFTSDVRDKNVALPRQDRKSTRLNSSH